MKKNIALLLVTAAITVLAACGNEKAPVNNTPSTQPSPSPKATEIVEPVKEEVAETEEPVNEENDEFQEGEVFYYDENGVVRFVNEDEYGKIEADSHNVEGFLDAAAFNQTQLVRDFIDAGINIDAFDEYGSGALVNTLNNNNTEIADILLENGANINLQNNDYYTPLIIMTQFESVEMVRYLLENGADPNIGGGENHDFYPIIAAAFLNNAEIVELLLEYGAYPNLEHIYDGQSVNALWIAEQNGYTEIVDLIGNVQ